MSVSRKALADAVIARLELLSGLTVFKGEVVDPPLIQVAPGVPDPSGRVAPYVVLYFSGGRPDAEPDLGDTNDDLDWGFQATVAAGYQDDCLYTIDRVHTQLYRWAPTVAGLVVGRLKPPLGFEPGTVRRDDDLQPPRFYLPLLYSLTATT